MDYLFYQVAAINGFDADGHYLRAGLILNACSQYAIASSPDCLSTFGNDSGGAAPARRARQRPGLRRHAPLGLAAPARRLLPRQDAATRPRTRARPKDRAAAPSATRPPRAARPPAPRDAPARRSQPSRPRAPTRRSRCSTTCWGRR